MAVNLIRKVDEINVKGALLVLGFGNMSHFKKRSNTRLMRQFAIKAIDNLFEEKKSIKDSHIFDKLCVKYYEYSLKFCLNL